MPRFRASTPAIVSHRSPRAARRPVPGSDGPVPATPLSVRQLFESSRIARNVTVSRQDDGHLRIQITVSMFRFRPIGRLRSEPAHLRRAARPRPVRTPARSAG
ncbi:hypothetical protein E4P36_29155 [Streptomyces sp. 4R-3d]|nr:hypothetical protein E4P36_29155 [Streptomyces sp. 4R-3d]